VEAVWQELPLSHERLRVKRDCHHLLKSNLTMQMTQNILSDAILRVCMFRAALRIEKDILGIQTKVSACLCINASTLLGISSSHQRSILLKSQTEVNPS
jgi:hypothetical protein